MIEGKELALAVAKYADSKQAEDIVILDLTGISTITDFFVICNGGSLPHLKAIRRGVADQLLTEEGVRDSSRDGSPESHWMVLDYGDVILHVFHEDKRANYALEELWSDAPRVPFQTVADQMAEG
ncbi:MAG: ribosome-associated protein [Pseudoalteromonas tetraodonis]|jgi:ribosome-associated protein